MTKKPAGGRKKVTVPDGGWQRSVADKVPRMPAPLPQSKTPVLDTENEDVNRRRLVWRFNEVDRGGVWPPANINPDGMALVLEKMGSFESMTVGEIFAPGSQLGKKYPVENLPDAATKRLLELEKDDEAQLVRLRMGNLPRLYGFLREHVFHVLWWDPHHHVWPSKR